MSARRPPHQRVAEQTLTRLTEAARDIIIKNDRGAFTVPTDRLYPHQWNWDSAFVSLAWQSIDEARAWRELRTLFAAQWPNGMVPHIIYHAQSDSYFPDVAYWGKTANGNSSGISQNPVAASCALKLWRRARDRKVAAEEITELLPRIDAWHQWFFTERRDATYGLIAIVHPWESGRDNACDWDRPLSLLEERELPSYERKDLLLVPAEERPRKEHYTKFVTIIEMGKENGWQWDALRAPFSVADPALMAILIAAERDLATLADEHNQREIARRARARHTVLTASFDTLWDTKRGVYRAYDLRHDTPIDNIDIGAFLPLYAGIPDRARAATLLAHLEGWLTRAPFGAPSHDPHDTLFEAKRYWRGSVWLVINFLLAEGVSPYGRDDLAERMCADSRALVIEHGFREYYDPLTGEGLGGKNFSWSAAMWLYWLRFTDHVPHDAVKRQR